MPPGTPFNSFIKPYEIRVDNFTDVGRPPRLYLLTHTHSDHTVGLSRQSFGERVICSADAKEMLLNHEVYKDRALHKHEFRAEKKRTFAHLKTQPYRLNTGTYINSCTRDLLVRTNQLRRPLPYYSSLLFACSLYPTQHSR
jgi:glyoxylase-like metal-dependent hydrolase (beta-lactamase superfamily II)